MDLITHALTKNSPPLLRQGLDRVAHSPRGLTPAIRDRVLEMAVKKGKPDVVRFLVDECGFEVGGVRAGAVGAAGGAVVGGGRGGGGEWGGD